MFFKSKKPEIVKEDSRIQDLNIITQLNQELATTLDLNETLQNALEIIIKRINAQAANIFLIEEKKTSFSMYCIKVSSIFRRIRDTLNSRCNGKSSITKKMY